MPKATLSLELDEKAAALFAEVQKKTGSETPAETIRKAVALLNAHAEHKKHGGKTIFRHADGREEELTEL